MTTTTPLSDPTARESERIGSGSPQTAGQLARAGIANRPSVLLGPVSTLAARRERLDSLQWSHFDAKLIGTTIGANISGLDLAAGLNDDEYCELRRAMCEYKLLVFRDQQLDRASHLALAQRFGELERHPFLAGPDNSPELVRFEKDASVGGYENVWHTDVTWREQPALGAVLRAVELPPYGGDTLWADMAAAYDGLPDDIRDLIEDKFAVHDFLMSFGQALDGDDLKTAQERYPAANHPVVRVHPETGEKCLFVNSIFTRNIVGMDDAESERVLDLLFRHAAMPEYQVRIRWEPGMVVIWDNRSTQHYASSDYWPHRRVMERAAIAGDRPVGPIAE